MEKKNVIFNHTLEQYNKKYKNRNHRLLKYTKKEVEDFDRRNNTKTKNFLLEGRRWWFINNTYYEIPKPIRYTWFRNLNAGIQTGVCVLGAGVVATAITVPTVIALKNKGEEEPEGERNVDVSVEGVTVSKPVKDGDNLIITLTCSDSKKEITDIEEVRVGNASLDKTDYSFEKSSGKLTIKKSGLDKGKKTDNITITPKLTDKEAKIILNKDKVTIGDQGKYYQLKIKSMPQNLKDEKPVWTSSNPKVLVEDGKVHTKDDFRGDEKATITCVVGKEYGICEVTVESTYNIDWGSKTHSGQSLYDILYDTANHKTVKFLYSKSTSGEPCGETEDDKIYFSNENNVINIWADKKISFEDDDRVQQGFFNGCGYVDKFIFENIDTSSVEDFSFTFNLCNMNLLDLKNINVQNAKNMAKMITGGGGPNNDGPKHIIGLENLDTSNVEDMSNMFDGVFLKELDLSNFDTSNVKYMRKMFKNSRLNTIYISEKFNVEKTLSEEGDKGVEMFNHADSLVGRKNTSYNKTKESDPEYAATAKYAKLDGGEDNPGYFSDIKENTPEKLEFYNTSVGESYTCEVKALNDETCKGHIRIPDEVDGSIVKNGGISGIKYKVNAIQDGGFDKETHKNINVGNIYLTPNIETIGSKAFNGTGIHNIDFGLKSKLKNIRENAFYDHVLNYLCIPSSVETIEDQAFYSAQGATADSVLFETDSHLKTIGSEAFVFEYAKYFTIPHSVTTIGNSAFKYCGFIDIDCTSFTDQDDVPSLGQDVFKTLPTEYKIYTLNQSVRDKFKNSWSTVADHIDVRPTF